MADAPAASPSSLTDTASSEGRGAGAVGYYSVISRATPDGRILIGEDLEVVPSSPCPDFDSPGAPAYEVINRRDAAKCFALVCGPTLVPRVPMIGSFKSLQGRNILKMINAGIVHWTPDGAERFLFLFEKPNGKKLLPAPDGPLARIADDRITATLIQPVLAALADFRNVDAVHGAVNLENIYLASSGASEAAMLGECLSHAPFCNQHPFYESTVRAMAHPAGRGPGTIKDDLYALGVCVATIARHENPMTGRTPEDIINDKIRHGSYAAIVGRERMPGDIAEFLRGVLNDDEANRWSIDEAMTWLEGRRISPKQQRPPQRAARPYTFQDEKYSDLRSLARAFAVNPDAAAEEIEKGQVELWLKRNFDDTGLKNRLSKAMLQDKPASRERLVLDTCTLIDPQAPPSLRKLAVLPGGFGTALAHAMMRGEDVRPHAEMILQGVFSSWLTQNFDTVKDAAALTSLFERARAPLMQKTPGQGVERLLYAFNPDLRCLSPLLARHWVLTPGNLLLALEALSKQPDRPAQPLDRHMIAFLLVREARLIEGHLSYINASDKGKHILGVLRALAAVQKRAGLGSLPGLGAWILGLLPPAIEMIHDHDLRQEISRRIGRLQDNGNLASILAVVDDRTLTQNDQARFAQAQREYAALLAEKSTIEGHLRKRKTFGRATGRQVSMLLSGALAALIILACLVLRFSKGA